MIINCSKIINDPAIIERIIGHTFVLENSHDSGYNNDENEGILLAINKRTDRPHFPFDIVFLTEDGGKAVCYLDTSDKWQLRIIK